MDSADTVIRTDTRVASSFRDECLLKKDLKTHPGETVELKCVQVLNLPDRNSVRNVKDFEKCASEDVVSADKTCSEMDSVTEVDSSSEMDSITKVDSLSKMHSVTKVDDSSKMDSATKVDDLSKMDCKDSDITTAVQKECKDETVSAISEKSGVSFHEKPNLNQSKYAKKSEHFRNRSKMDSLADVLWSGKRISIPETLSVKDVFMNDSDPLPSLRNKRRVYSSVSSKRRKMSGTESLKSCNIEQNSPFKHKTDSTDSGQLSEKKFQTARSDLSEGECSDGRKESSVVESKNRINCSGKRTKTSNLDINKEYTESKDCVEDVENKKDFTDNGNNLKQSDSFRIERRCSFDDNTEIDSKENVFKDVQKINVSETVNQNICSIKSEVIESDDCSENKTDILVNDTNNYKKERCDSETDQGEQSSDTEKNITASDKDEVRVTVPGTDGAASGLSSEENPKGSDDDAKGSEENAKDWETDEDVFSTEEKVNVPESLMKKDSKSITCDLCMKNFTRKTTLKQHMLIHAGEKPYACGVCTSCFADSSSLRRHMLVHTGEKPYQCQVCLKCFRHAGVLAKHKLVHTGERPYECQVCSKSFAYSHHYKTHMLIHTGEKPFHCDVCERSFAQHGALKRHVLLHTGEKPFQCDTCFERFARKESLQRHALNHTYVKPFICELCSKCFVHHGALTRHLLLHAGQKTFNCGICAEGFSRKETLEKHMLTHAEERRRQQQQQLQCDVCSMNFEDQVDFDEHVLTHSENIETK